MALKVGELFASFGIDSSGIDGALSGIKKKCNGLATSLAVGGTALTAGLTVPITKAAKAIYNAGTEFYAEMSRVGAVSNATADDMEKLTNEALRMASQSSFTTLDAATALEYMGMAGWNAQQMMAGLGPIMNLAAASGEELGTVSDIVTDSLTAFGLKAEDAAHFSDVLAAASTSANTNVGMMGNTFKMVAPLAGALGYSVDDVAVAIGLMANAGIKGEMAGTQLRNMLSNLAKPTKAQADAMKDLGISLTDSSGNMLSFRDQLDSWRNSFKGMTAEQKAYYATILAGKQGMSGFLALINATDEEVEALTASIEGCDGATERMAATMLDNAKGDVTLFTSAIDSLEVKLWGLSEGAFRSIVQTGTKMVNTFAGLDSETQLAAMKLAGLAAAAGPALGAAAALVAGIGNLVPAMAALSGVAGIVGFGFGMMAIAATDANNDIGKMLVKMSKTGKTQLMKFNKSVTETFANIRKRLPALAESAVTAIKDIVPAAVNSASVLVGSIMDTFTANAKDFSNVATSVVTSFIGGLSKSMPTLLPKAAQMVTSIASAVITSAPKLLQAGAELATSIWNGLKATDWVSLGTQLWDSVKSAFTETGDWIKQAVLGEAYTPDATWSQVGKKIWESIKSGLKATGDWLKNALFGGEEGQVDVGNWTEVAQGILDKIVSSKANYATAASKIIGEIVSAIGSFTGWDTLTSTFNSLASSMMDSIVRGIGTVSSAGADIVGAIGGLIGNINWSELGEIAKSIGSTLISGMVSGLKAIGAGGTQIVEAITGLIGSINWGEMAESASNLAGSLINGIMSGFASLTPDMGNLWDAIGRGIAAAGDALGTVAGTIIGNLVQALFSPENWQMLIETGGQIVNGIATGIMNLGKGILEGAWSFVSGTFAGLFKGLGIEIPGWTSEIESGLSGLTEVVTSTGETLSGEIENLYLIITSTSATEGQKAAAAIALQDLGFGDLVENSMADAEGMIANVIAVMQAAGINSFREAFALLGITIPESVQAGLDAGLPYVEAAAAAIADTASTANEQATASAAATATGKAVTDELAAAENEGSKNVGKASQGVTDAATLAIETLPDVAKLTGQEATTGMADGINNGAPSVETSMSDLAADVVAAAIQEMSYTTGYTVGFDYTTGINSGIEANAEQIVTSAQTASTSANEITSSVLSYENGSSIGLQFDNGIAAGIRAGTSAIEAAARKAAQSALNAAKEKLGIHSPSREARDQVGTMFSLGVASGILDKIKEVKNAASSISEIMLDELSVGRKKKTYTADTGADSISRISEIESGNSNNRQKNDADAVESIAGVLATAISKARVYMEGREVGRLVAPTVNEIIGRQASVR